MKKEVTSRTISGVLSGIILTAIWWTYGNLGSLLASSWIWLSSSVTIPMWGLIVLGTLATLFVIFACVGLFIRATEESKQRDWHDLTEIEHFGFTWQWRWHRDEPIDLHPICPSCQRLIRHGDQSAYAICPKTQLYCTACQQVKWTSDGTYSDIENAVMLEIEHAVRTGRWKDLIKPVEVNAA